jgi:diaminopimelate epimerase
MNSIPFMKYTSFGNNFVIVDETNGPVITELGKSKFAYQATNTNFGVGCDNFLVIQQCNLENLSAIRKHRGYWFEIPDPSSAEFIFRMFEPNGEEAYCCGNGLMCLSD